MRPLIIDLETSINKEGKWGPDSKDPSNDFYTIIYGEHPNEIKLEHKVEGFEREVPDIVSASISVSDVIVGHNLQFDLGYLWHTPVIQNYINTSANTIWDTALAQYLLTGQRHKNPSLAELQEIYLGQKTKLSRISRLFEAGIGAQEIIKNKDRCKRVWELYNRYCIDDGASTLRVFAAQYRQAQSEGMLPIIKAHMKGLLAVIAMQKEGICIDKNKVEHTLRDFKIKSMDYLNKATDLINHMWNRELGPFNINSPKQKSAILFGGDFKVKERVVDGIYKNGNVKMKTVEKIIRINGFGLDKSLTKCNKKGDGYVTDDGVINQIYRKCDNELAKEYCRLQKEAMRYGKMCSTYLEPFLNLSVDGVLYPKYNVTQTETGRLSSSSPNMQNVVASGEMLMPIQGQLVAPAGWICCDIDFSMLEIYVMAYLSRDKAMTNDLLAGIDFHCLRLSWIPRLAEGKEYKEIAELCSKDAVWALKRKKAKGISFKKAYGGGAKSLAEAEELEVEDVQAVFDAEDLTYPDVKSFNDRVFDTVNKHKQLSKRIHFAKSGIGGRQFEHGIELLPIFDRAKNKTFIPGEYRHFGAYQSITGRKYCFEEFGQFDRYGRLQRRFSSTETKNYQIQGTASDVVQIASAKVLEYVLKNKNEVKMVRQIHDALSFYIKKDTENLHILALCAIISNTPRHFKEFLNLDVPFEFPCEAKVGSNFGEML